jgi:hypothetical protein
MALELLKVVCRILVFIGVNMKTISIFLLFFNLGVLAPSYSFAMNCGGPDGALTQSKPPERTYERFKADIDAKLAEYIKAFNEKPGFFASNAEKVQYRVNLDKLTGDMQYIIKSELIEITNVRDDSIPGTIAVQEAQGNLYRSANNFADATKNNIDEIVNRFTTYLKVIDDLAMKNELILPIKP